MDITVVGTASRKLEAEIGELHFRVHFQGPDRSQAVQEVKEAAARITEFAALRAPQIAADPAPSEASEQWPRLVVEGLQTISWDPTSQTGEVMPPHWTASIGMHYRATRQHLQLMVDHLSGLDGIHLAQLAWSLTDRTREAVRAEVLTAAVRDAHARALVMAEAAGAKMLEFVQLADPGLLGGSEPPVPAPLGDQMRTMRMGSEASFVSELSITLEPDLLEFTEQVHARFRA